MKKFPLFLECQNNKKSRYADTLANYSRIKYTDDKINQLVFELYGLSEEEVGIVEGASK